MLSTRLREELAVRGLTKEKLAELCDLPVETIRNIYYGKTADPKVSTVLKIANALEVSVNCLMEPDSEIPEEREVLRHYRECGIHGKSLILLTAKYEALTAKEERQAIGKHMIPCLIQNGDLSQGIQYDTAEKLEIYTSDPYAYSSIKLTTNDLVPFYCKGDIILIHNRFPSNGEYGVFYQNGRAYLRKYIEEGDMYILRGVRSRADDMCFKRMDSIEFVGTCCGVVRT